jgi:hypothetical protein
MHSTERQVLMNSHFAITSLFLLTFLPTAVAADGNTVDRNIFCEKGAVLVEDRLSIHENYAFRDHYMFDVFYGTRDSATNLADRIRTVYMGEDLDVQRYTSEIKDQTMNLWVRSKVVFPDKKQPAKLRWESFLGGQKLTFPKGSIGRTGTGLEMLIFENDGAPVLWFPDLGPVDEHSLETLDQSKDTLRFLYGRSDVEYSLHLKTENVSQEMFFWVPGAKLREKPDSSAIIEMSRVHQISHNDIHDLVGEMRIAKSGYYIMKEDDAQTDSGRRVPGSQHSATNGGGTDSSRQFKIDGSIDDWTGYTLAWPETGSTGRGNAGDGIDVKEFYYCNDDTYLYLFLRCNPTLQERYEKIGASGMLAWLYIDSDSNPATGASQKDESGNSAMLGTDIRISVPIGIYTKMDPGQVIKGCNVLYRIENWDGNSKDFSASAFNQDSKESGSLIAHGKDGVEIALPLSVLRKRKGDRFDLICVEAANDRPEFANRTTIKLK